MLHIAVSVGDPQAPRVARRPARARQAEPRERGAAGAQSATLRRQLSGQSELILFFVRNCFTAVGAGEAHPPAASLANHRPAGGARKGGAESGGDGEAPFSGAIGNDAHRVAAEIVRALENPDWGSGFGVDDAARTCRHLERIIRVDPLPALVRRRSPASREQ